MNTKVDEFLLKTTQWHEELIVLRNILLQCQLTEEFKWKQPCYTYKNSNIAILGKFKDSCVLSFFKGALLNDAESILVKTGENTQSARIIRFTNTEEIVKLEPVLKSYIFEAIEIEKVGLKVDFKKDSELIFPQELYQHFEKFPNFKKAFYALTPGRQRGYNLFFSAAKQSATKTARIEKYFDRILDGKGINDCTCGFSKKPPSCDGSHKYL